jgi:hypothetical protein
MNAEQRTRLEALITQSLISALEAGNPSAALIDKAIAFLAKVDAGTVKQPELEKEKAAALHSTLDDLPFPAVPHITTPPTTLAGLPFTTTTGVDQAAAEVPAPRRDQPLGSTRKEF